LYELDLICLLVIATLMILGPIIGNVFSKVNSSLSGVGGGGGIAAVAAPQSCDVAYEVYLQAM